MPKKSSVVVIPSVVPAPLDPTHILTLAELAERLKVSERWIYEKSRKRCQDPLPVIRIGRYLRFHWLDVSAWMRAHSNNMSTATKAAA
jgi:predicted DNA-binding transcriptional regulator AlpA